MIGLGINVIDKITGIRDIWWAFPTHNFKEFVCQQVNASYHNIRFQYNDKLLFLSICGNKTLAELGFQNKGTMYVAEIPALTPKKRQDHTPSLEVEARH